MESNADVKKMGRYVRDLVIGLGISPSSEYFQDCVQEALLSILDMDQRMRSNKSYVRQAAKWAILGYLKRERREKCEQLTRTHEETRTLEEIVMEKISHDEEITLMRSLLSKKEVMVYMLCVYSPLSQRQIGEILGIRGRSVRRIMSNARRALQSADSILAGSRIQSSSGLISM